MFLAVTELYALKCLMSNSNKNQLCDYTVIDEILTFQEKNWIIINMIYWVNYIDRIYQIVLIQYNIWYYVVHNIGVQFSDSRSISMMKCLPWFLFFCHWNLFVKLYFGTKEHLNIMKMFLNPVTILNIVDN